MESIEFFVNNQKLKGVIFFPDNLKEKNPAILFIHGWTSEKIRSYQYAEGLIKLGFICMLFDMRGHGESEGDIKTLSAEDFLNDDIAAYDYFSQIDGVNNENISVVGSSLGGYLAALLTTKRRIHNLVLRAPADYPNNIFNKSITQNVNEKLIEWIIEWRKQLKKAHETFALEAINAFRGSTLIIESENDIVVPHQTIENYMNAVKDKKKLTHILIKNAPHSIKEGPFRDEVTKILLDWFKDKS